jgi:hypothetical protein
MKPTRMYRTLRALVALMVVGIDIVTADLVSPQFVNPIYPAVGYTGSRVLETNYTSSKFVDFLWTQSATVDSDSNVWLADTKRHLVVRVPPSTTYFNFASEGVVYAGTADTPGFYDGSVTRALLNGTQGIAVLDQPGQSRKIYIADTGNHCIRRIDTDTGRIFTIAGIPGEAGLRDGDGRKALFNFPTSIGIESVSGLIVVQDKGGVLRKISTDKKDVVTVTTLVQGACRGTNQTTVLSTTVISRTVRCQINWGANSVGSTQAADSWEWPTICMGNNVTCSSRYSDEL